MRKRYAFITVLLMHQMAPAQAPVVIQPHFIDNAPPSRHINEFIFDMLPATDTGFILVGADTSYSPCRDNSGDGRPWIVKADKRGNILWSSVSRNVDPYGSAFMDVKYSNDGGYVAGGSVASFTGTYDSADLYLVKYN